MVAGRPFDASLVPPPPAAEYEKIFENYFLPCSHGFRPGLSQQTCLRQIRRDFGGTIWYIQGQHLTKYFDQINHETVRRLLRGKIRPKNLGFVQKGMMESLVASARRGIIQGGFDPLTCNIVLHEVDKFVTRLKRIVDRGRRQAVTPAFMDSARSALSVDRTAHRVMTQSNRTITFGTTQDLYLRRINYTRFADDFIIGMIGPRSLAVRIEELVKMFMRIRLGLKLDPDATEIFRAKDSKIPFLGYFISRNPETIHKYCRRIGGKWITYRVHDTGSLCLLVDMPKVIRRLAARGFCDKSGEPKPNFKYYQYPQDKSVAAVGRILRGLANYYHLANTKRQAVNRLSYILRSSLAKTYAAKFKLGSSAKVYARGGRDLSRPIKVKDKSTKKGQKSARSQDRAVGKFAVGRPGDRVERSRRPAAIPYTKYREISHPDTKGLSRDWQPLRTRSKRR